MYATDGAAVVLVVVACREDAGAVEVQAPRAGGRVGSRGPVVAVGTLAVEAIAPALGEDTGPSTRVLPIRVVSRARRALVITT